MKKNVYLLIAVFLIIIGVIIIITTLGRKPSLTGDVDKFRQQLENNDFTVQEGKFGVLDIIKMADLGLIPSCWGNNPSTPYMIYKLPLAPGQTVPNTMSEGIFNPDLKDYWNDYRLRPDEAVVFIGNTPPEASYYSYRSYLELRYFPEEDKQKRIFASLGDTINNMSINVDSASSSDIFDKPVMIITTADTNINEKVHQIAKSAGYSQKIINDDKIPYGMVRMGLDKEADTFAFIHRMAFFNDKTAGDNYMANSGARVFRITPKTEVTDITPHKTDPLRVRGTGDTSELDLAETLEELRQAIHNKYSDLRTNDLKTSLWLFEGFNAIQGGIDVIGENRDTTYLKTESFKLDNDPSEFVIVYGVNHALTQKATYSNFGVYGEKLINGVGAVSNKDLEGTADEFLPNNSNSKYFYVWKVARNANSEAHTLEVPFNTGAAGIDLDQNTFIGFRAYLETKTKVGPFWSELLYDRAIKFSK
ncbi:MAG: hypothetical protein HQ530_04810 [Parcubacteria group bacterium]|nr:hypothetical protein [Parcubacteria group bacterium]